MAGKEVGTRLASVMGKFVSGSSLDIRAGSEADSIIIEYPENREIYFCSLWAL